MTPLVAEQTWIDVLKDSRIWQLVDRPTIVIAPHPDDETLAAGGFIAEQCRRGIPVVVVAATDGEAAYAGVEGLGRVRKVEQEQALELLGVPSTQIKRFCLPDSNVASHEEALAVLLAPLVNRDTLVMAPWSLDFHPDHEACGRAARRVAQAAGAILAAYVFWTWHRAEVADLIAEPVHRFELSAEIQTAKRAALACHRSQLERNDGLPILPPLLLAPARRSFETFIIHD